MIYFRAVYTDAVLVEHLAICIPLIDIILVIIRIWLLDTSSRWSIETCNRQPDTGAVAEETGLLDKALSIGTAAYDSSPVVILHCPGENFAGRSRILVHEHGQADVLQDSLAVSLVIFTFLVKALKINYLISLFEEHVRQQKCLIQIASGIVTQVENQMLHIIVKKFLGSC